MVLAGLTCWDPVTGQTSNDLQKMASMSQILGGTQRVLNTGSSSLQTYTFPDWYADIFLQIPDLPWTVGGVENLAQFCREQKTLLLDRLTTAFPSYDWTTPQTGAVEVIDKAKNVSDMSLRLWDYYKEILNPTLATPHNPIELYSVNSNNLGVDANIARCQEIVATPDTTSNVVMRCELAYRLIIFSDAADALTANGL